MKEFTLLFLIFGSIHLICFAGKSKFSEVQIGCIIGTAENDTVTPSRIQCLDSCVTFTRLSTGLTRCMAVQYFAHTSMCRMHVHRRSNGTSVCGPKTPSLFAIHLVERYSVHAGPSSWTAALDACHSNGGYLATITSQAENDNVNDFLSSTRFRGQNVWLGAKKTVYSGLFYWANGEMFSYTAFEPGQPTNGDKEDCLVTNGRWYDRECKYKYAFLCQY